MSSKHCELSPRYKLIYYPFRGRAELVRFIFAHLNIPYKDERIPVEEWIKRKPGETIILRLIHNNFYGCITVHGVCSQNINAVTAPSLCCADSPFGVIPILEFDDGRTLSGSTGIARLLSEQHGQT